MEASHVRLSCFFLSCFLFGSWEFFRPAYSTSQSKSKRWQVNLCLAVFNTLVLQWLPILPLIALAQSDKNAHGVLSSFEMSTWLHILLSFLAFDMMIYWQHRLFHRIPWLWQWHRVHHEDQDLDLSSGVRFHTVEMLFSTALKMVGVLMIGAHPLGVVIAEIVLNTSSMFQHSNISIGKSDHILQKWIVTPCMHRIHHSIQIEQTDSNFSFSISLWDHLFGTYHPPVENENFPLGTEAKRLEIPYSLTECLALRFKRQPLSNTKNSYKK